MLSHGMKIKPSNWPPHLQYIQASQFHSSVSPAIRLQIHPSNASHILSIPNNVAIRPITNPTHPSRGQFGLFAVKKIPPHVHIIDYTGEIHCDERPSSDYDLSLYRFQDGPSVGIDASEMGNEARFINDYRGIADKPNAVFTDVKTATGAMRMSIWSSKEIKKGEEILVSYGKAWWRARSRIPDNSGFVLNGG